MKSRIILWIALVLFAVFPFDLRAQTTLPSADLPVSPEASWRDAIEKIEAARLSGRLTTDQAARYRLWALGDPTRLPPEFQPTAGPTGFPADGEDLHDGLQELAEMLDALFADQADWSPETRMEILGEFEEGERRSQAALAALPNTWPTAHFAIHWNDTGPDAPTDSRGLAYVQRVADGLEYAWSQLAAYNYQMPNPADFGEVPGPGGIVRFDVSIVHKIKVCGIPIPASGVTLPGDMWIPNYHPDGFLQTLTAHELFHILQWNYAGFHDSSCPTGKLNAWGWYTTEGAWLMESTATWIEDEIYPGDNRYIRQIDSYTNFPDVSLFAGTNIFGKTPGAPEHQYGAVVFIKFLQEHLAAGAGYPVDHTRDIVRDIWENVPLQYNSTVGAVTDVLMHPPSGATPYADYNDTWRSIFGEFAVANYLKRYADSGACAPPLGSRPPECWPDVNIFKTEYPRAGVPVERYYLTFEDPGSRYVEILPTRLGLPGGKDATGAKLHLEFQTTCGNCTLDVLTYFASGIPARTTLPLTLSDRMNNTYSASADLATNFGGAGGVTKAVLVFSNGAGEVFPDTAYYVYILTTTDNSPEAPAHLTATADANTLRDRWISLQWDQVQETGVTYSVYRSQTSPVPIDNEHRIASSLLSTSYRDRKISWETTYFYVVTAVDRGKNSSPASGEASTRLVLFDNVQVAPNPFTPNGDGVADTTTIAYILSLPAREKGVNVSAEILDIAGNLIRQLSVEPPLQGRGGHSVTWDGSRTDGTIAAAGLYTIRITAKSTSGWPPVVVQQTAKVLLYQAVLTGLAINGPSSVDENTSATYTATATFSDGSTMTVTPSWSENSDYATINSSGVLTTYEVLFTQSVTITASYTYANVTKTATKSVTIVNVAVVLTGLAINGPSSVDENKSATYTATATFSDGSTKTVNPSWSENSPYATINSSGVLTTTEVPSNQSVTITATYTFEGVTKKATKSVTIHDWI